MNCWQTLGIAPTGDEAAIKTAYAALIRQHRPDRDPAGFRRVRAAYEEALRLRHHYEIHRDEPRRPTGWTPSNPPVAADDSDENSISQHDPSQPYPLAESTAHNYRDTLPATPEQPYPLAEPAAHYPALVAWLKQNRLRRWWTLRRRFLNCDPGPVWQDWRRLYDDTGDVSDEHYLTAWPRLRELMRYHLPLAGLRYGWFIDIAIFFLLPAYAAYTGPRPNPYAAYRCITCPAAPATSPEPGLPLASILITWLLLRGAHILWRTKYAVSAGWLPPRPQDGLSLHITRVAYTLGLIYSLIPPNWRPLPAQTLAQTLTATLSLILYGHAWCRLPPEAVNLRRAMLDHGVIAVLIAAACITGAITDSADSPLLTVLGLIASPLLALVLIYSHYPPLFNRKTAKGLVVADTAVMALGICVLGYIILRQEMSRPVAALSSLLTAGIFIHFNPPRPETIPRSLLAALFRLFTLIGLYSAAVFALIFLMGRIIDASYGLLPALTLLALYTLHITATFIHSNRQQHA